MSAFAFPLITSLVAGDIVASETQHGTLKTILTRSKERGQIFSGKALAALTYMLAALAAMAIVGLAAGAIVWGFHDLPPPPGPPLSAGRGLWLLVVALGYFAVPLAGVSTFGVFLSTVTRNSAASVVGALMWYLGMGVLFVLPGTEVIRPYLLFTQFDAWHGLLRVPVDWAPIAPGAGVSLVSAVAPLVVGYVISLRRAVAGE